MDKFEQSDLMKETNHSQSTFYQNAINYKERENAFMKNNKSGIFSLVFNIK